MKRNYHVKQTLSALHEKSAAWMGLGSSAMGLWRQRRLRACRLGVFLILSYLACLFTLSLTTPTLINVSYPLGNETVFSHVTQIIAQVGRDEYVFASCLPAT